MNVYVRETASALARSGVECDVFTRASAPGLPEVVEVEPGLRVHHVAAGPEEDVAKEALPDLAEQFTAGVLERMTATGGPAGVDRWGPYEAIHANYWLSGLSGHVVKHELDLPLVCTFHTLDRVKAIAGLDEVRADLPHRRAEAEATIIACSDAVLASCAVEADQLVALYGADPSRIRVVAPAVDHAFFGPGHRQQARRALGIPPEGTLLLFVGRIQPLKGVDVAVRTLAELHQGGAPCRLVVVGGPSGPEGPATYRAMVELAGDLGVVERLVLVAPQPHELLSTYYRAADVCLVPSRSESFGLVALEAAACGTPVVAAAVGGLTALVVEGRTGFLVDGAEPGEFAAAVRRIADEPLLAEQLSTGAVLEARRYTWRGAAARLLEIYDELAAGRLVECS